MLAVVAALPMRWTVWTMGLSDVAFGLATPASAVFTTLTNPLRRRVLGSVDAARFAQVERERAEAMAMLSAAEREVQILRHRVEALQAGARVSPDPVRQLAAGVVARPTNATSGLLLLSVGEREGVREGAVATVDGVRLLGRVARATSRQSWVLPATEPSAGPMRAVIELRDGGAPIATIRCELAPTGDRKLAGKVWDVPQGVRPPAVGDMVRLDDPELWPATAQRLEIGLVTRVDVVPDSALRLSVTVEPSSDLRRATEVVLRLEPGAGAASMLEGAG